MTYCMRSKFSLNPSHELTITMGQRRNIDVAVHVNWNTASAYNYVNKKGRKIQKTIRCTGKSPTPWINYDQGLHIIISCLRSNKKSYMPSCMTSDRNEQKFTKRPLYTGWARVYALTKPPALVDLLISISVLWKLIESFICLACD